jgi:hypothetical protein
LDVLFDDIDNPEVAFAKAKEHRGHLSAAYLRLLKFLVQHKTGLGYAWAQPDFPRAIRHAITEAQAKPLIDLLGGIANLGAESVELIGSLEKADVISGTWRLATEEGTYTGKRKEGGPSLEGLKLAGAYKFACLEEIQEVEGTGRAQRMLYLIEHQPA